jgi:ABC-type lipoprotein export system ATPase subunit
MPRISSLMLFSGKIHVGRKLGFNFFYSNCFFNVLILLINNPNFISITTKKINFGTILKKHKENYLYQLKNLSFSYSLGPHQIEAIKNITLDIVKESLVTFSGPSGSGKSTLLNILGLIEPVQRGEVLFQNEDLSKMNQKQMNRIRKYKIGFIFQQFHLIPVFTAEENVAYFLARQGLSKEETQKRTHESLKAVGLWEHRMKKPSELSGGQRQRVAIARAIAKAPEVIIGDEPTASLDQKTGKEIMEIFDSLVKRKKVSVILATHDTMIQSYADQNFHIQDGTLFGTRGVTV